MCIHICVCMCSRTSTGRPELRRPGAEIYNRKSAGQRKKRINEKNTEIAIWNP